jgi:predicted DNA-binding transcriptional regulator AlpA
MATLMKQGKVPHALKNFDHLPDSANVRRIVVESLLGCSRATIWRMVRRGALPAPRKLTKGTCAWNVGDLRKILTKQKG